MSGKTEWATRWAEEKQNRVRVSWSEMLKMMGRPTRDRRVLAYEAATHLVCVALQQGKDVVLDECNLYPPAFAAFMTRASLMGARVEWHTMRTSAEECKRRNALAGHPVADMEIDRMAEDYRVWLEQK